MELRRAYGRLSVLALPLALNLLHGVAAFKFNSLYNSSRPIGLTLFHAAISAGSRALTSHCATQSKVCRFYHKDHNDFAYLALFCNQ